MRALTGNTAKAELKVSVWNARQFHAGSASEDSASQEKLRWIQGRLDGETPDVCFLLEVTGTRDDYTDAKRGLRARMKDSGYSTHWIPGEGGSARERKGTDTNSNGIAILTRNQTCKLMSYRRLEERLLGALVRLKGENPCNLKIGAIHGLHEEGSSAFSNQIEAASTWAAAGPPRPSAASAPPPISAPPRRRRACRAQRQPPAWARAGGLTWASVWKSGGFRGCM